MRMRSRRAWLTTAVTGVAALALAVAGCGSGSGSGSGSGASATIKVWLGDPVSPQTLPYVQKLADQFEKTHKNVTIQLSLLSDANAHQQYITAIEGGSTPCIGLVGNTWTPEFAGLGALQPITATAATLKKTYVASMVDSATYQGKVYGYPYDVGVRALIYRTDLFTKANLTPPATWTQLEQDAVKLQSANSGVSGFAVIGGNQWYYLPMVWNWGGDIAVQQGGKWVSGMDSSDAVAAYQFYANLLRVEKLSPSASANWQGSDADQAFALGKVAMMVGGSWDLQAILAQTPSMQSKIGTALLPDGPAGNNDTFAGGSNLSVFKNCADKADANSFIQFLLQNKNVTHLTSSLGLFPATLSGVSEQEAPGGAFSAPLWKTFALQVPHSRSVPEASTWGGVEGSNDLINAMQAMFNGQSASTAMSQLASQINTQLNSKTS
jgi:N,N'-diacetylchitobiose transport system substrate-binding protein